MKNIKIYTFLALATFSSLPSATFAMDQTKRKTKTEAHRRSKQDEWKQIGIGTAAAAVLGLVTKNGTLTTLGAAGTLYSAYRYEEDRKSMMRERRERAALYGRRNIIVDGKRYKRIVVMSNGKKYYKFVRA